MVCSETSISLSRFYLKKITQYWSILTFYVKYFNSKIFCVSNTILLLPERARTKIQLHYSIFIIYNKNTWLNILSFLSVCLVTASQRSWRITTLVRALSLFLPILHLESLLKAMPVKTGLEVIVSEATEKPRVLIIVQLLWSYIVTVFPMLIRT